MGIRAGKVLANGSIAGSSLITVSPVTISETHTVQGPELVVAEAPYSRERFLPKQVPAISISRYDPPGVFSR